MTSRGGKNQISLGLRTIVLPSSAEEASFNIIAVHGLGADPEYTWTARREGKGFDRVAWLKDFLSQRFPQARIMVFNHNADRLHNAPRKTPLEPARDLVAEMKKLQGNERPFILIGHSFDGIIIKQALILKQAAKLRRSVQGIIFLGTPHLGSSTSNVAAGLLGLFGGALGSSTTLLTGLKWHDTGLDELNNEFIEEYSRDNAVQIHCFYETKDTRYGPLGVLSAGTMVDKTSASLAGLEDSWKRDFIDADHSSMNKFASQDDLGYRKICNSIDAILEYSKSRPSKGNTHWMIPRQTNKYFTGREDILQSIEADLMVGLKDKQHEQQCRIVISGLGGQGKSEICLQIANRVRQMFWAVFWVDVNTPELAEAGFLAIAELLGSNAQNLNQARTRLSACQESWLLVLDNADDPEFDYQQYIPGGHIGAVLMTTRVEECKVYATRGHISLEGLPVTEATELLLKSAQIKIENHDQHEQEAQNVANRLNSHPLALIQAGYYIAQGHCSLGEYPAVYGKQRTRLMRFRPRQAQSRYGDVYATFEASARTLIDSDTVAASDALVLLSILGLLDQSPLPVRFFENVWKGCHNDWIVKAEDGHNLDHLLPWHVAKMPAFLQSEGDHWDAFRLQEAAQRLKELGLITLDKQALSGSDETIQMHPLTHAWAYDRLGRSEQQCSWFMVMCICAACPRDSWQLDQCRLSLHLRKLVLEASRMLPGLEPQRKIARALYRCAMSLSWMADYSTLLNLLRWLQEYLGLRPDVVVPQWTDIYRLVAGNWIESRKARDAVKVLEQVLKIENNELAETSPSLLSTQHKLGLAYELCGRVQDALRLLEHVVKIRSQTLAEDHPDLLASRHALVQVIRHEGRTDEAVEILEHVVNIRKGTLPEDHPYLLSSQHELASAYRESGRVQEAIGIFEHVVNIRKQRLAEDSPSLLSSQNALAIYYWRTGLRQEALSMMTHVVDVQTTSLAEDHPNRLASEFSLAIFYWDVGLRDKALSIVKHVVDIRRTTLPEGHSDREASDKELTWMTRQMSLAETTPID